MVDEAFINQLNRDSDELRQRFQNGANQVLQELDASLERINRETERIKTDYPLHEIRRQVREEVDEIPEEVIEQRPEVDNQLRLFGDEGEVLVEEVILDEEVQSDDELLDLLDAIPDEETDVIVQEEESDGLTYVQRMLKGYDRICDQSEDENIDLLQQIYREQYELGKKLNEEIFRPICVYAESGIREYRNKVESSLKTILNYYFDLEISSYSGYLDVEYILDNVCKNKDIVDYSDFNKIKDFAFHCLIKEFTEQYHIFITKRKLEGGSLGWTKGNIIILDGITSIDSEILGIMSAHEMIHCMGLDKQQYTKDDDNCTVENCLMNKDPSKSEGKLCGYCESGLKGYLDGLREASKAKNSKE